MTNGEEFKFYHLVYDILVRLGGALETQRTSFVNSHLSEVNQKYGICKEWRFQGNFGFGGKYWSETNKVSYYHEDETPERKILLQKVNEELETLNASTFYLQKTENNPPSPENYLKDMMEDFSNLLDNSWYYVRNRGTTLFPGEQERNEKYVKDLYTKWEKILSTRFLM